MTQLTPAHFELHDSNKARSYERKKSERQKRHELFINARNKLDKLANAYNKATNEEIRHTLFGVYQEKARRRKRLY